MRVQISLPGFFLAMDFDPNDEADQEILAEAYLLMLRRGKADRLDALNGEE